MRFGFFFLHQRKLKLSLHQVNAVKNDFHALAQGILLASPLADDLMLRRDAGVLCNTKLIQ